MELHSLWWARVSQAHNAMAIAAFLPLARAPMIAHNGNIDASAGEVVQGVTARQPPKLRGGRVRGVWTFALAPHDARRPVQVDRRDGSSIGHATPQWKCQLALDSIADAYAGLTRSALPPLSQHGAIESEASRHFICDAPLSIVAASA